MLAAMIGIFLSFFLIMAVLIGIATYSLEGSKETAISPNSVLRLTFDKNILDRSPNNPFENFDFSSFSPDRSLGLNEILENIDKAKTDENIKGIFLELSSIPAGYATVGEIRKALEIFKKESGKFIIAYSELLSQKGFYLASVADQLYLNPEGYIEFFGLSANIPFFKGALEKLDIEPQIIRHGKFKSAVEPFLLDKMSEENREQTEKYINSIWNQLTSEVAVSRNISVEALNLIADSLLVDNAEQAVLHKLADSLMFKDEVLADLRERLSIGEKTKINFVNIGKYNDVITSEKTKKITGGLNRLAVIYAQGGIVSGDGEDDEIGSEKISKAIRKARLDNKVKAIVLRVNSGGGSALASDVILREIALAKKVKPVVVSMGDVAASGGYYIACAADTIVANSNTITGSIGVFGLLFNAQNFFKNKLGITFDVANSNAYSDIGNPMRPLTGKERKVIQKEVERIYDVFITHVSKGRNLTKEQVDSIGQGRVWSGLDAKKIGLVDVLGGLQDAIDIAAGMAKLKDYRILELPGRKEPLEQILSEITGEAEETMVKHSLGDNYKHYKQLKRIEKMEGIQAVIPYDIELR